ncbi:MAG: hypothetical protein J7527_13770 [Chitinophagaceae bacterium]|nr:hypothetical protein [Chitinophagaceae bacterium]
MNTDTRQTIPNGASFYAQLEELFKSKQTAGLLYEDHGVTRANGLISALYKEDGREWIELEGGLKIAVDTIYALNGIFRSDYSEC